MTFFTSYFNRYLFRASNDALATLSNNLNKIYGMASNQPLDKPVLATPNGYCKTYRAENAGGTPAGTTNDLFVTVYKLNDTTDTAWIDIRDIRSNHMYAIRKLNGAYQDWITIV